MERGRMNGSGAYDSTNALEEDSAYPVDLDILAARDGDRVASQEPTAMLDMTRCPGCGLWNHQWNVSARGHCLTCEDASE